jgi:hypothetical protein
MICAGPFESELCSLGRYVTTSAYWGGNLCRAEHGEKVGWCHFEQMWVFLGWFDVNSVVG